ncbi:MAG TPA: CHAT domain-containing protein [Saprospiraceae bacterium]|nr:CHAT domain-containing protein [Saprospiraceae bacterium]
MKYISMWSWLALLVVLSHDNLLSQEKQVPVSMETAWNLLLESKKAMNERNFRHALVLAQQSDSMYLKGIKLIQIKRVAVWDHIGYIYYYWEKYDSAAIAMQKALDIYHEFTPLPSPQINHLYNNLGVIYRSLGRFDLSVENHQFALDGEIKVSGEESLPVAFAYWTLGTSYQFWGKPKEALENHLKGFEIRKKLAGPESILTAHSMKAIGTIYSENGNLPLGIDYLQHAMTIYQSDPNADPQDILNCQNNLSDAYKASGNYLEAVALDQKSLTQLLNKYGPIHSLVAQKYNHLGTTFLEYGDLQNAKHALEAALKAVPLQLMRHDLAGKIYGNLGVLYHAMGDLSKAVLYNENALQIEKAWLGDNHESLINTYYNLGSEYISLGKYQEGKTNLELGLKIEQEVYGEIHPSAVQIYNQLAVLFTKKGDFKTALELRRKAKSIADALPEENKKPIQQLLNELGAGYIQLNQLDSAEETLFKSLAICREIYAPVHPATSIVLQNLGDLYDKKGNISQAEKYYALAVKATARDSIFSPNLIDYPVEFIERSSQFGDFYLHMYTRSKNKSYLNKALSKLGRVIPVLDVLQQRVQLSSKLNLANVAKKAIRTEVEVQLKLFQITDSLKYLERCFYLFERSKAFILFQEIQDRQLQRYANIPDSLLDYEHNLKVEIEYFKRKRLELTQSDSSVQDSIFNTLTQHLLNAEVQLESLKLRFEKEYPGYRPIESQLTIVTIPQVKQNLVNEGQSLVEYFQLDSSLLIMTISSKNASIKQVKLPYSMDKAVDSLLQYGVYAYYGEPLMKRTKDHEISAIINYSHWARELYQKLLEPIEGEIGESLIVVPDGPLSYVPFEILLQDDIPKMGAFKFYPYVLLKHPLSYAYSATLLSFMKKTQIEAGDKVLAVAPFYKGDDKVLVEYLDSIQEKTAIGLRDSLQELPYSGEEAIGVAKILGGSFLLGSQSTKSNLYAQAGSYNILHLATHAEGNMNNSSDGYLALSSPDDHQFEKWYYSEIFNATLPLQMVVLSACETGVGAYAEGEGVLSISRPFALAGAKSVVASMWKVEDRSNKEINISFYKYLRQGLSKDQALRDAKMDFLKKSQGKASNPFFWAGMIALGDMRPINSN